MKQLLPVDKSICLILFLLMPLFKEANAQITLGGDSILLKKFDFEVKQMSEFFDRFNFNEPVKFADSLKPTRTRNIISLFNLKDTLLYHSSETGSFIKFAGNDTNKVYLNYGDHNWFSLAHCSFTYHGKSIVTDVILKPEGSKAAGYKWVIFDVKGDLFNACKKGKDSTSFINPMNHEIEFSELSKALIKKNNVFAFTSGDYQADPLSIFLFLVKNGDLKFIQINSVDFLLLQISGWAFTVKNFNRSDFNSGWLISSLKKMNDNEKMVYLKNHFIN